jgi:hypothetical protein
LADPDDQVVADLLSHPFAIDMDVAGAAVGADRMSAGTERHVNLLCRTSTTHGGRSGYGCGSMLVWQACGLVGGRLSWNWAVPER